MHHTELIPLKLFGSCRETKESHYKLLFGSVVQNMLPSGVITENCTSGVLCVMLYGGIFVRHVRVQSDIFPVTVQFQNINGN
jgi:hypothetical protein